jgi:hypothetical protein
MPEAFAGMKARLRKNRNRSVKLFAPQIEEFVIR